MANDWWNQQRIQNQQTEPYRAGDQDAHRNDRDMAFGNFNQRPNAQTGYEGDQYSYGRHDLTSRRADQHQDRFNEVNEAFGRRDYSRDYTRDYPTDAYRGQGRGRDMGFGYGGGGAADIRRDQFRTNAWDRDRDVSSYGGYGASNYESSRFNRESQRDWGLGLGRDENDFAYRSSYAGRGPKGYRRSDERIREEVSEMLERDPFIDASEIEVDVKDGVVTLRGHTEDRKQKRMAEDTIEHLSGVRDVRNELMVNQSLFQRAKEALFGGSTESASESSRGDLVSDGTTQKPTTTTRNPRH